MSERHSERLAQLRNVVLNGQHYPARCGRRYTFRSLLDASELTAVANHFPAASRVWDAERPWHAFNLVSVSDPLSAEEFLAHASVEGLAAEWITEHTV